jgi:hypothetical protein
VDNEMNIEQDNDARFALHPTDPFSIQVKPNGHGDVHSLLKKYSRKTMG